MPADEVHHVDSVEESRERTGARHAAPRKTLLTRLHVPAGKAIAIAAMPTAVLMGMGLTPTLAQAKGMPKNPFQDGPCVSAPDDTGKDADEADKDAKSDKASDESAEKKDEKDAKDAAEKKKAEKDAKDEADKASPKPSASDDPSSDSTKSPEPAPSESSSTKDGGLLGGLGDTLGGLLGGGDDAKDSASPTPTPSATSDAAKKDSGSAVDKVTGTAKDTVDKVTGTTKDAVGKAKETADKAAKDAADKAKDAADKAKDATEPSPSASDPLAADENGKKPFPCVEEKKVDGKSETTPARIPNEPWTLEASALTLKGLDYKGVVNVTTPNGKTKQALKFTADDGVDIGDLHQIVEGPGGTKYHVEAAKGSTSTIRGGQVTLYTERLQGNLFGLIPIVFDPEHPPPLNIPIAYFTNVKITQAGQFGGNLTVPGLHQSITNG